MRRCSSPVDLKRRLFAVVGKGSHRDRLTLLAQAGRDEMSGPAPATVRLREAAFDASSGPQLVVDFSGRLVGANAPARSRFGLTAQSIGQPLQDLELSYRPAELRGAIARAMDLRIDVAIRDVPWNLGQESRLFDVTVGPLLDDDDSVIGSRIVYEDVTELRSLQAQLQHSKQELETAYEELQSTNEELETTNEELQSTVEELETTNEELQSTNEELETMNEELQSTNEELQTMNDELRSRSGELNSANAFLESMFASLQSAVVVVDRDLRVQVWNERSTNMWGLRPDEAEGSPLLELDIGLSMDELRGPIRNVLGGSAEYQQLFLSGTNRRGKPIQCRVGIAPLRQLDRSVTGILLLMDEQPAGAATS